jgi:hypothetical protein
MDIFAPCNRRPDLTADRYISGWMNPVEYLINGMNVPLSPEAQQHKAAHVIAWYVLYRDVFIEFLVVLLLICESPPVIRSL